MKKKKHLRNLFSWLVAFGSLTFTFCLKTKREKRSGTVISKSQTSALKLYIKTGTEKNLKESGFLMVSYSFHISLFYMTHLKLIFDEATVNVVFSCVQQNIILSDDDSTPTPWASCHSSNTSSMFLPQILHLLFVLSGELYSQISTWLMPSLPCLHYMIPHE